MTNVLREELSRQEEEQIKSNIDRIISSYRHVWDIYTELLQNSADALLEKYGDRFDRGTIKLEINTGSREIIISDNGVGIEEDNISRIIVTGKSLKREKNCGKFGFMGYGFTFVAFQTEYLKIESVKNGHKASRTYRDLYKFVYDNGEVPNSYEEENNIEPKNVTEESGTVIKAKFPQSFPEETVEESLAAAFRIATSKETMSAVLRTKTIVGFLDPVFDEGKCFNFSLIIDNNKIDAKTGYLTTREIVSDVLNSSQNQFYNRELYESLVNATEQLPRSSKDQARKAILLEEKIKNVLIGTRNPLKARVLISATSKTHINHYNERFKGQEGLSSDFAIDHGLWLSICGMPIGVCLDAFDKSDYLPYTVIVDIQDEWIRRELDAGRKGISAYRMNQIAEKVYELLRTSNFIKYRRYVVGGGDSRLTNPLYDPKKELRDKLVEKKRFDSVLVHKYFPPLEEQEVISLFFELIVKDILKGYKPVILSGYQVYDGLFNYALKQADDTEYSNSNKLGIRKNIFVSNDGLLSKEILIEFKKSLNDVYKDIDTNRKDLSHIDILVCWDVNFDNRAKLQGDRGDILQEKDITMNVYYGVTHQLIGGGRQQPLPIIELKKILQEEFSYGQDRI
jgi:hypothetical protein